MLRDAAVSLIASRMGQRTDLNDAIILEMGLVITTKLEENAVITPWFLLTESATSALTIDEERLAVPDDFIVEDEENPIFVLDTESNKYLPLKKIGYDEMVWKYKDSENTIPSVYAITGLYFTLRPLPNAAYAVKLRYYGKDPVLVSDGNVENRWLKYAPDLVIAATCAAVARGQIHDVPLAESFNGEIAGAWTRLKILNEARQHANRRYEMGEE